MDFNDINQWTDLDDEKLAALTKEDFGWYGNSKLWNYSGKEDLDLTDEDIVKDASYVRRRLDGLGTELRRAAVVLLLQARAGDWYNFTDDPPTLMHTIRHTLRMAGKMNAAVIDRGTTEAPLNWTRSLGFIDDYFLERVHHTEENGDIVYDDDVIAVQDGLKKHYGDEAFEGLERAWNGVFHFWLGA